MKVKSIKFLGEVEDIFDDNTDVSVTLENAYNYVVVVATHKNILTLMDQEKSDFLSAGDPMIIVRKLTKEVVEKAIEAYAEDEAYNLKFYAAEFDVKTLDEFKDRKIAEYKDLIEELKNENKPIEIENDDLIDL